jgi:amino acid adenylation domain-containing protein
LNSFDETRIPSRSSGDTRVRPTTPFILFRKEDVEQSVSSRFEQQVSKYPGHLAIKKRDHAVTYDSLNRMANRIARTILFHSGEQEQTVALLTKNDVLTFAAILGILKAGKIYVPLDSSLSVARAKFILKDTEARILLASNENASVADALISPDRSLINIDDLSPRCSDENLGLEIPPTTLAHVLYTSGSTGEPKGVADFHRNVLHHVMRVTNPSHICMHDRMALPRPPSSSGALLNAFSALLNGTSLFPLDIKDVGLAGLAHWLIDEKITFLHSGGTVFRHFAQLLTGHERFPDLRLIKLSSGMVSKSDVDLFKQYFPDAILLHVLSSTETLTYRMHFIDKKTDILDSSLPVGYPVEDMDVLILDEAGKELGLNSVGEIAVRSAYLFQGYWKNPALTDATFLPNPEGGDRRIFRTGDLGRLRPDGCLECVGRKDFQLKIRGHSIQAEEVELALLKIPEIEQTAVVARPDNHGDDRLVAYIVPCPNQAVSINRLRDLLKATVPDYMIPSMFVVLGSLPLRPNGKVNRQTLPPPGRKRPKLSNPIAAPRTAPESIIAKIWSETLGIDEIGTDDNFFDLGGDSILASKIVATVTKTFSWGLSVREFFEAPTVARTSQILTTKEPSPGLTDNVAQAVLEVESMSPEDISRVLRDERNRRHDEQKQSTPFREED